MNSTDLIQFLGVIAVVLTFIGSTWIQEQRRRHDLLRGKFEELINHLRLIAMSQLKMMVGLMETDWSKGPEEDLVRFKKIHDMGLGELFGAIVSAMSIAEVYFPEFRTELRDIGDKANLMLDQSQSGDIEGFASNLKAVMKDAATVIDRMHREFATATKSTYIPSEL